LNFHLQVDTHTLFLQSDILYLFIVDAECLSVARDRKQEHAHSVGFPWKRYQPRRCQTVKIVCVCVCVNL